MFALQGGVYAICLRGDACDRGEYAIRCETERAEIHARTEGKLLFQFVGGPFVASGR